MRTCIFCKKSDYFVQNCYKSKKKRENINNICDNYRRDDYVFIGSEGTFKVVVSTWIFNFGITKYMIV